MTEGSLSLQCRGKVPKAEGRRHPATSPKAKGSCCTVHRGPLGCTEGTGKEQIQGELASKDLSASAGLLGLVA